MKKSDKIKVGISVGDLNGIGIEIILKSFEDNRMMDFCTPVIFASSKAVSFHKRALNLNTNIHGIDSLSKIVPQKLNLLNVWKELVDLELGKPSESSGRYALKSLEKATEALKNEEIDILVTAPIDKNNIQSEEFSFKGHTEFLENKLDGEALMILCSGELRVGLITGHVPVSQVSGLISEELITKKVDIMYKSLVQDFNISKPKIAVLGLNPHCGDQGVIGKEDDEIVRPVLEKIQKEGQLVYGPYAADSFFGNETYRSFDGILAMYHDQGLAPFKTLAFGKGVNFTAGLEKIRTSPDHGTAYEIAGKGKADYGSFKEAIFMGIKLFKARKEYNHLVSDKLKIHKDKKKQYSR
ncbi:4-hydroxythreonine-4-phosphate dehydrogenase PdxA [Lutimonas zeaxanthinifaciens]|uniref:4-hydroxythreonine-4-phosphate dehydrogenase PdxA n=1 Tax=Lutimonas zeaxanthinifaciens TaxID=3060215 RepID=UPI00265CF9DB|nr:4-hydroxythreonine-4-phosphate dehydrogenase PdxA [Lutimonas sp. YSD2104]WKK65783.1 4-hydroxythreonine-4-phosphate dehydrogenase PdxA [Lutimonas sp. YSD2104]